jgi:crotonobetainyl-CoA:carnitine CoA-transferase CaiB-like acyl-CoA transferase
MTMACPSAPPRGSGCVTARMLGANTREVLATIGYDDAKLDGLKKQRII